MSKPPVRQDALATAPQPISAEVQAQIAVRGKRRAEERKKERPKGTFDLPLPILAAVADIAERESCAQSDIVALALAYFVADYRAGKVNLAGQRQRARSLRYEWKLTLPAEFGENA
jgi:hypothetical protein